MKIKNLILKSLYLVIIISSISCGDGISNNIKNISGKYYLVESEVQNIYSICYRTAGGDYTGRIPENVIEYAVVPDSLIVAKSFQNGSIYYYLIKTNQDSDYAHEDAFLIGPLNEKKFNSVYKNLQIKFTKVNSKLKYTETNNLEKDSLSNYDHYQFVNDTNFYEEHIFDTVGKKYSEDLTALLDILSHYKIEIPAFKYSYILKLHINAGGVYDNFILSNDKMPVFRASFNRNITPTQIIYYKFKNGAIDSSIYEFLGIGKLNKL